MKLLVVDDEERFCQMVAEHLAEAGHDVTQVTSGAEAVRLFEAAEFDVVITDLKMTPVDGIQVLTAAKAADPETDVVLMTAYGTVETAVAALRQGAYDYLTKPFRLDELTLLMERIQEKRALRRENAGLRQELASVERRTEMVGTSTGLARVRELVAKVAPSDATVLVLGESGVGKELVAREIHRRSARAERPFVVVHAAALPENLLESELFGYEKGAFTGAQSRKLGRLELAEGGTLFFDEIGDISPAFQVKLLRFLQERTFVRVGGTRTLKVDARIVAATNQDLAEAVRQGGFREDLYYRLSVFPIQVPPLRERRADIIPLARHILARLGCGHELDRAVTQELAEYDWPGNVRELENVLERAMILAAGAEIGSAHIQLPELVVSGPAEAGHDRPNTLYDAERRMLEDALRRAGGNKSKAARLLGITRRILYTKLERLGLGTGPDHGDGT